MGVVEGLRALSDNQLPFAISNPLFKKGGWSNGSKMAKDAIASGSPGNNPAGDEGRNHRAL